MKNIIHIITRITFLIYLFFKNKKGKTTLGCELRCLDCGKTFNYPTEPNFSMTNVHTCSVSDINIKITIDTNFSKQTRTSLPSCRAKYYGLE